MIAHDWQAAEAIKEGGESLLTPGSHFDTSGLPTEEHFAMLAKQPHGAGGVLIRNVLPLVFKCMPVGMLAAVPGGPKALFRTMCALEPAEAFAPALRTLAGAAASDGTLLGFLIELVGEAGAAAGPIEVCSRAHLHF